MYTIFGLLGSLDSRIHSLPKLLLCANTLIEPLLLLSPLGRSSVYCGIVSASLLDVFGMATIGRAVRQICPHW